MELTAKELLSGLYHDAVDAVDGRYCVQDWLQQHAGFQPQHVIAIGKAGIAMLQGAFDARPQLGSALGISKSQRISRELDADPRIELVFSSHPVPDAGSLRAGDALLRCIAATPGDASILFLVSGGASSLVEVCRDGYDLDTLQRVNRHLLASGKSIHEMNAWRKQFSRIKGGGLLDYIGERQCVQLMISDVKGDDPSVIGSGLLVANSVPPDDDPTLRRLCTRLAPPQEQRGIETHIVATLGDAMAAVERQARAHGLECVRHDAFVEGEAGDQGERIAGQLKRSAPGIHVFGGETTVTLPDKPGTGGRNQQLALALGAGIEGEDLCVLCAGTDGIDGDTPCAGALVTGATAAQARRMGFDISAELAAANAGTVLMATGDLFRPGASNTNVMDIIIAYKRS